MPDTVLMARVGYESATTGSFQAPRMDEERCLATMQGHGRLHDLVDRGNCYGVCNQSGVTSQAGLSATTPVLTLFNPPSSGVNLSVLYCGATFSVAFATAGAVFVAVNTNTAAAVVTGTLTTAHRNLKLGGSAMKAIPYLAATLPAAPVAVDILGVGLTGAITTIPVIQTLERWYMGGIILQPNTALSLQTGVASGASGMFCTYLWEEVPVT